MKNLIPFLFVCLFTTKIIAQPIIEWERSFGGSNNESAAKILNTTDGGYLVGASATSNNGDVSGNHGNSDFWLTKINSNGVLEWQKCHGGLDLDAVTGMDNTIDGGYIIVGNTLSNGAKNTSQVFGNRGGQDIWVVKVDENGAIEWRQCYGGCDRDDSRAILQTADGNYVIAGATLSNNSGEVFGVHGDWDAWVFKIASDGDLIWQKTIGGSNVDYLFAVEETQNGDIIIGGTTASTNGDLVGTINKGGEDYWIAKLSPNGNLLWNKTYGGSDKDGARGICIAADGNIIVTGQTGSFDGDITGAFGGFDAWVLRLDANGGLLWQKVFGGSAYESGFSIFQRGDNDFILAAESTSGDGDVVGNHGGDDAWVVKFDKNGVLKNSICLGGSENDFTRSIVPGPGNSVIVSATTGSVDGDVSINNGFNDVWVVKLSVPLGLKPDVPNAESLALTLSPNPAINSVQILTNAPGIKQVDVFDELGKLVLSMEMTQLEKSMPILNMPSGIYIVRVITQNGQVLSGQFIKA